MFLICEHCGAVGEAPSAAVADQLKTAARAAGFTPKAPVIEITGICAQLPSSQSLMADIPASHSRPLDGAAMALVVLLCVTWGFNQLAVKLAMPDVPPLIQCTSAPRWRH